MSCNHLWRLGPSLHTDTMLPLTRQHLSLLKVYIWPTFFAFPRQIFLLSSLCIAASVGGMKQQTTSLLLCCCVFWKAVLWVLMVLVDHSWERQACIFVGWMRGESQLSLGCWRSYGRREICYFHTVRGKVMMQHGWERETNRMCYITLPVFQDFRLNCQPDTLLM